MLCCDCFLDVVGLPAPGSEALLVKLFRYIVPKFTSSGLEEAEYLQQDGQCCYVEPGAANELIFTVTQSNFGQTYSAVSEGLAMFVASCEDNCTAYGETFPGEACCKAFDVQFDGVEFVCRMYSEYYLTASTVSPVQAPTGSPTASVCPGGQVDMAFCSTYAPVDCSASTEITSFCPAMCTACPTLAPVTPTPSLAPSLAPSPATFVPSAAPTSCAGATDAAICTTLLAALDCTTADVSAVCHASCGCSGLRTRLRLRRGAAREQQPPHRRQAETGCRVCHTRDDDDECATLAPTAAPTREGADIGRVRRDGDPGVEGEGPSSIKEARTRDRRSTIVDYSDYGLSGEADYRMRRQLVIPIQFSDQDTVTSIEDLKQIFNSRGGGTVGANTVTGIRTDKASPAGSVRDFWLENSYHKADTVSTVIPEWVPLSNGAAYYAGGDAGKGDVGLKRICFAMAEALAYVRKNYPDMNWADFVHETRDAGGVRDTAASDKIYEVLFMQSGYPAELGSDGADKIWSHQYTYSTSKCEDVYVNNDLSVVNTESGDTLFTEWIKTGLGLNPATGGLIQIKGYMITNGCYGDGGSTFSNGCEIPRLGVIAHEMGHGSLFGTPIKDYYEVAREASNGMWPEHCGSTGEVGNGIGTFGLMGDSWGMCGDQFWPPQLSSWSKVQLGWIVPIVPPTNGIAARFALYPSEQCPDVIKISRNFPSNGKEKLFVEHKATVGVDSTTARSGVAVIHVDDAITKSNQKPKWTDTTKHPHYYIRVEQADGSDELECGSDKGSGGDLLGAAFSKIGESPVAKFSTASYSGKVEATSTYNVITAAAFVPQSGDFGSGNVATVDITTSDGDDTPATAFTDGYSATCIAGQYSDRAGACHSCPIGKYNPYRASETSVACNSACQVCPDGTYSDTAGAIECIACENGKYDDITYYPNNATSCKDCATREVDWGYVGLDPISHETDQYCTSGSYTNAHRGWEPLVQKNGGA